MYKKFKDNFTLRRTGNRLRQNEICEEVVTMDIEGYMEMRYSIRSQTNARRERAIYGNLQDSHLWYRMNRTIAFI